MKHYFLLLTVIMMVTPAVAFASNWSIDGDHSSAQFKVRHLMVSNVKGEFGKISGVVSIDDNDITRSTAEVTIETATINTGVAKRDEHLRSPDFFDVTKYPAMTFVSTKVAKAGSDRLKISGNLTIHGVTKAVVLDVEGPSAVVKDLTGNYRRGASATTKINRKDFGLLWNKAIESGGVVVGDEVSITIEVELLKK